MGHSAVVKSKLIVAEPARPVAGVAPLSLYLMEFAILRVLFVLLVLVVCACVRLRPAVVASSADVSSRLKALPKNFGEYMAFVSSI